MGEHVILQPMLAHHLLAAHLADVQRALEMRHLRMDLQRVQVGKALATILAGVAESRLLVHRLDMLTQCAAAAQDLAAVRTGVGAQRRVVRALVAAQRLLILKGLATDGAAQSFHPRLVYQSYVALERLGTRQHRVRTEGAGKSSPPVDSLRMADQLGLRFIALAALTALPAVGRIAVMTRFFCRTFKQLRAKTTAQIEMQLFLVNSLVPGRRSIIVTEGALEPPVNMSRLSVRFKRVGAVKHHLALGATGHSATVAELGVPFAALGIGKGLAAVRAGALYERLHSDAVDTEMFDSIAATIELFTAEGAVEPLEIVLEHGYTCTKNIVLNVPK